MFSDVDLATEWPAPWRHIVRANPEKSALDLQNLTVAWNGLDLIGFQLHLLAGLDNTHLSKTRNCWKLAQCIVDVKITASFHFFSSPKDTVDLFTIVQFRLNVPLNPRIQLASLPDSYYHSCMAAQLDISVASRSIAWPLLRCSPC